MKRPSCRRVPLTIAMEGGNDSVLIIRAINTCIQQLKGEVDQHLKLKRLRLRLRRPDLAGWST